MDSRAKIAPERRLADLPGEYDRLDLLRLVGEARRKLFDQAGTSWRSFRMGLVSIPGTLARSSTAARSSSSIWSSSCGDGNALGNDPFAEFLNAIKFCFPFQAFFGLIALVAA